MNGNTWRDVARSRAVDRVASISLLSPLVLVLGLAACDRATKPTPVCTIALAPPSQTFSSAGGDATVTVTASADSCQWTAAASAPWVAIMAGGTGTGSGAVNYRAAENPSTDARSATLTVGSQTQAITQQGRPPIACSYALEPTRATIGARGGAGDLTVSAPAGCEWTATSSATFVTITSGAQGTGNGTVSYRVSENSTANTRTATIIVADQTFTITQQREAAVCAYSVAPVEFSPCMADGTGTTQVTTAAGCSWTAGSNVSWLTITSGRSGSGSGQITFSYRSNYLAPRTGIVMVRWPSPTEGQNVRVNQAGCRYGVSQPSFSFAAAGGSASFNVVQQSDPTQCGGATQDRCVWSATSSVPWITISSSMPRTGDDKVNFTVAPNGTGSARTGTITVADHTIQVTQEG